MLFSARAFTATVSRGFTIPAPSLGVSRRKLGTVLQESAHLSRPCSILVSGSSSTRIPHQRPPSVALLATRSSSSDTENVNDAEEIASSSKIAAPPTKTKIRKTQLRADLKQYRLQQSAPLGKPAYTIFTNAALEEIYSTLPTTLEELLSVKGIGPKKLDMFGADILSIVAQYTDVNGGARTTSALDASGGVSTIARPALMDPKTLTAEQCRAVDLLLSPERPNVFVSGRAGTGKSYVLKFLVQELQHGGRRSQKNNAKPKQSAAAQSESSRNSDSDTIIAEEEYDVDGDTVTTASMDADGSTTSSGVLERTKIGVCAPTGVAAIHVGGSTLHSFFGIGLGTGSLSSLVQKVKGNTEAQKRIDETDALIIDECSMLSSDLLETIDAVVRQVRRDGACADQPFGGMQVVCFGDFFQLPPIARGYEKPFCFDSPVWSDLGLTENMIELKEVQRQGHGEFVDLLNKVRIGQINNNDIERLNSQCVVGANRPLPSDGITPTRLYSLNKDVDAENETRLTALKGDEVVCLARNVWKEQMPVGTLASVKKNMADSLSKEMPDEVRLKVGAQVMLTRNKDLENNLVNGSRGVVTRFEKGKDGVSVVPVVRFDCGVVTSIAPVEAVRYNPDGGAGCLARLQVPLKLAWAITVHKSQGTTLTRALLDISSAFEFGQCYVALSRVRSLEGLWLEKPARLQNIKVSPQVLDFYNRRDMRQ